ncbi:MAG: gamma-glutamyl-gamma-aminobutyrate hydrolase family protein [Planctomycetota bacterium]|jgi:putative glutamine amidotransferase
MEPVLIGLTSRALPLRAADQERPVETVARAYVEALEAEGALCVLLPSPAEPERAAEYAALLDGVVLTGGDDPHAHLFGEEPHPGIERVDLRRDRFEIALVKAARGRGLPLFGICRGVQLLNIALGGDIYQDIAAQTSSSLCHSQHTLGDEAWHEIEIAEASRLAGYVGRRRLAVNSFHHQACRRPGEGLQVVATATGDGLVEAVEDPGHPFFLGVQWHPEIGPDAASRGLFEGFVRTARETAAKASKV